MKSKNFVASFLAFCLLIIIGVFFLEEESVLEQNVIGVKEERILFNVSRVIDGDSIVVEKDGEEFRVRMIGIDTPETVHPKKDVEFFGIEASNKLKEMIENKEVELLPDPTQDDVDRYGRLLRYVYLDDLDVNLEMIKQGYAFEYTYRVPYEKQGEYKEAQEYAKENNLGLWKE